ncbi:hypothetical protein F751_4010 [Auxenochlorella protothecoides]|uniref:Uncharacterized protein n=1 Tax=Auxenochlorella protothecoides TaxID=3075 RepID=A0A087SE31_AUXPR|nr:hypothetical protein F751_4010 [Auxenochlorella protothecoides]KFM23985.1 hypothetical protein F751_4010 [Auxenochlorella protothecoides]
MPTLGAEPFEQRDTVAFAPTPFPSHQWANLWHIPTGHSLFQSLLPSRCKYTVGILPPPGSRSMGSAHRSVCAYTRHSSAMPTRSSGRAGVLAGASTGSKGCCTSKRMPKQTLPLRRRSFARLSRGSGPTHLHGGFHKRQKTLDSHAGRCLVCGSR